MTDIPVEEVPVSQVPMESAPAISSAPASAPSPVVDAPAVDLPTPPPPPAAAPEPGQSGQSSPSAPLRGETGFNAGIGAPGPTSGMASSESGAVAIDPARELPSATSAPAPERPTTVRGPATATNHFETPRASRKRAATARPPQGRTPAQEMLDELRPMIQELIGRVEQQAAASAVSLRRELAQDAEYAKIRARYYHLRRPLQALGAVAAGGFFFGLFLGLWRR